MLYDPVKDRLFALSRLHPVVQKLFYRMLGAVFLRTWYVKREVDRDMARRVGSSTVRVLDAGTGLGQYAYWLARKYRAVRIDAVDVKEEYVRHLSGFFERVGLQDRVTVTVDDLTRLSARGPYDLVLAVDVMEHIEDDEGAMRCLADVMAPGGLLIVNTPSDLGGSDVRGDHEESFIGEHVRDGYNREELESKLIRAGLSVERSLYGYGPAGGVAWRLLVKWPIQLLGVSWFFAVVLVPYYLIALPVGMLLNAVDMRRTNPEGTGLCVSARRPKKPDLSDSPGPSARPLETTRRG